ncbi:MAG: hypothetical protein B7X95_05085 [Methylophilaceae bacterium 17-44-8]|nr:MAG: hypothetical protein B7X95_05085 [Methylophilaceae bacterium 17-44-8]
MAYTYEALSELEAVNLMLATIGSSPISSLVTTSDLQVSMAQQFLYDVSREVQTVGYQFNTEEEYPLPLNIDYEIVFPSNTLSLDISDVQSYKYDVVMRGNRLYDRKKHTYTFTEPILVDITFFLPFSDLPQAARQYIAIVAARRFQRRVQGDDAIEKYTAVEEQMAKAQLEDFDASTRDYNLGDDSDVFMIISR